MTRRQLSHLDLMKLWNWVDQQTLTHTDSNASLAHKANKELGFDVEKGQGVTESNVRGVLKKKNLHIPIPPPKTKPTPPPEPEPVPVPEGAASAAHLRVVADELVKLLTLGGHAVSAPLATIAHPQVPLFQGQTP